MTNAKTQSSNKFQNLKFKTYFGIKEFGIYLSFGFWTLALLLPATVFAAEKTFDFPAKLVSGDTTAESTLVLPFDTLPTIAIVDLGNDGTSEIALGAPKGFAPEVRLLRQDGSIINRWFPYGEKFRGGIAVKAQDINNDGKPEIITAPIGAGNPHILIFNTYGKKLNPGKFDQAEATAMAALVPKDKEAIITIAKQGASWQMAIPRQVRALDKPGKAVLVDLSDQKLSYFQDGLRVATDQVSTGAWSYPTPIGEFAVINKIPRAYSKKYGLYMPWWMAFAGKGSYGLHELPEWPNGYKEGENHLGTPVSHGCIRLGVGPAKALYDWAEVGTKVIVQK